jgi:hypothetical protein
MNDTNIQQAGSSPEPAIPARFQDNIGGILTAVDKALKSVPPEPKTITGQVLAELDRVQPNSGRSGKHVWPSEVFRDGVMIRHNPSVTLRTILGGATLSKPDTLEQFKSIQSDMKSTFEEYVKHSRAEASKRFLNQTSLLTDAVLSGSTVPTEVGLRSREAVAADFRAKQSALHAKLVKLSHQAAALAEPIIEEARNRIIEWMEKREEQDKAECAIYGIAYHATAPWQAATHLLMRIRADRLPKPGFFEWPSRMLAGIVNLN